MKKIYSYIKPYAKEAAAGPMLKLFEAGLDLAVPLVIGRLIDYGAAGGDVSYIVKMCLLLVLLAAIGLAAALTAQFFAAKASIGFVTGLRHAVFEKIGKLSYSDIDRLGGASLITRMTSDMNQLQNGVNLILRLVLRSPFVVAGSVIAAFFIDVKSGFILLAAVAVLFAVVFGIMGATVPMYRKVQSKLDGVTGAVSENLEGARVVRAFCREEEEKKAFNIKNRALYLLQKSVGRISALMNPVTFLLVNLATVWLIHSGAISIDSGSLTQGQLVALYNYMAQILIELVKSADLLVIVTKAAASAGRLEELYNTESSMKFPSAEPSPDYNAPAVSFDSASLRYSTGDAALENVTFSVKRGLTVGVIGSTGSGKTSLVNLIPRFYDATGGEVRVFGVNVKDYPEKSLRDRIGVVPQKAALFSGTIRENLLWGSDGATDEDVASALEAAQALDVIAAKDGGLDAAVEPGGANFSGGQRQRLTIARALVRKPDILILDDSASALDLATDLKLRQAIASLDDNMTVFIVSQRASSVMSADTIIVLEDGCVVGMGTHGELLESCGVYGEIYASQFSEEAAK